MTARRAARPRLVGSEATAAARRAWQPLKETAQAVVNYRGQRRAIIRRYVFPLLSHLTPSLAVHRNGVWYFVDTADQVVSRDIYAYGSYDKEVMAAVFDILGSYAGRRDVLQGGTFVDIGANIGTSTITALTSLGASRALAFEPEPENLKLLRSNLVMNGLDDRVTVFPVALSDRRGSGTLELSSQNWGDHRVRVGSGSAGRLGETDRRTIEIQLARFDDVIAESGIEGPAPGMVWVDTQGHEGHVLAGAPSLVQSDVPVVVEYWPYGLRRAGGLAMLHDLIASNYREVVDIRASVAQERTIAHPAGRVADLEEQQKDVSFTDLLLLK